MRTGKMQGGMIGCVKAAILTVVPFALALPAQLRDDRRPRFEGYPVSEIFSDSIAAPRIAIPEERRYRTAIVRGVRQGLGVIHEPEGTEGRGPNFAGKYIIVQWGCGSDCLQYAVVDAKAGTIYQPPAPGPRIGYFDSGLLDYRVNSRLMVVKTNCAAGDWERCDLDFYVWENDRFRHLFHERREAQ